MLINIHVEFKGTNRANDHPIMEMLLAVCGLSASERAMLKKIIKPFS